MSHLIIRPQILADPGLVILGVVQQNSGDPRIPHYVIDHHKCLGSGPACHAVINPGSPVVLRRFAQTNHQAYLIRFMDEGASRSDVPN